MFNRWFSGSWRLSEGTPEGLSKKKILGVVGVFVGALSLSMYAASSLPASPSGSPVGGTLSSRFTHMAQSCPARTFLKGFDSNHNPICASYKPSIGGASASPISLVSGGSYPAPLSGQSNGGFLATFLSNLSGTCPSGYIVKGFVADGKKMCERSTPPFDTIAVSASSSPSLAVGPTTSGPTIPKYITFATKIATSCTSGETAVTGVAADGTVSCGTIPVDGEWSGWSGWSSCSASCGGGTQSRSRSCNSPSPRNGGDGCAGSSTESQSCNTQACPVNGSCGSSANTCNSGSPTGYSAGSCGGSATWTCNGANGGSSASCSAANGACEKKTTTTTPVYCSAGSSPVASPNGQQICNFSWPKTPAGQSASLGGTNGGTLSATCDTNGAWQNVVASCPNPAVQPPVCVPPPEQTYYGQWSTYDDLRHGPDAACASISGWKYTIAKGYTAKDIIQGEKVCSPSSLTAYHNGHVISLNTTNFYQGGQYGQITYVQSCYWANNEGQYIRAGQYLSSITCTTTQAPCVCIPVVEKYFTGTGNAYCQARGQVCQSTHHYGRWDSLWCDYGYDNTPGGMVTCSCP